GQDVDIHPGQLAGKTHVLAATPDGQRQLFVGNHDLDLAGFLVKDDLAHLGGLQGVDQEGRLVVVPGNDVDLFALQLAHDGLDAAAAHAHAGADRVDAVVIGNHGDFRAAARIAGYG